LWSEERSPPSKPRADGDSHDGRRSVCQKRDPIPMMPPRRVVAAGEA